MNSIVRELAIRAARSALTSRLPPDANVDAVLSHPEVRKVADEVNQRVNEMPEEKPFWKSKVNLTQFVSLIASVLIVWGIDLTVEQQTAIVVGIQSLQAVATWIFRTWFTRAKLNV